jgi:hypothetical protein
MLRWIGHNWQLKLLAVLIAGVVWFFVVSADRSQVGFAAPVEYVGLEASRLVIGTPRETVDVQLAADADDRARPRGRLQAERG